MHRIRCVQRPTAAVACRRDMRMRFSKRSTSHCCTRPAACCRRGPAPTPFAETSPAPLPERCRARAAHAVWHHSASLALWPKVLICVEAVQAVRDVMPQPDARDGPLAEVRRIQDLHGAEVPSCCAQHAGLFHHAFKRSPSDAPA